MIWWFLSGLIAWFIVSPPWREQKDIPFISAGMFILCVAGGLASLIIGIGGALNLICRRML